LNETEDTLAIKEYLLGRLALAKQEVVEQRLLADDSYLEDLLIAEDELIDEYLGNKLSVPERESFRRHFLSTPERREKLRFAQTFRKYIESNSSLHSLGESKAIQSPSWFQSLKLSLRASNTATAFSLAAALLLAVLAGLLLIRDRSLQRQLEELRVEKTNSNSHQDSHVKETQQRLALGDERNAQLNEELQRVQQQRQELEAEIARLEKEKLKYFQTMTRQVQFANNFGTQQRNYVNPMPGGNTAGQSFMTPVLALGGVRSETGGLLEVSIPKGTGVVSLPLRVDDDKYQKYRASLITDSGQTIHTRKNLKPRQINGQRVVVFTVPAGVISPGEFQLRLIGATRDGRSEPIGSYYFRAVMQ
jgi:hypothetical protein